MITLYDMGPCQIPGIEGYSPFVRSIIYTLKFKRIPYEISLVNWITLAPTAKSIGAPPTSISPDKYTVPFIYDSNTGKVISDSFLIAEYLDASYPDTPQVIPNGSRALQAAFCEAVPQRLFVPMTPVVLPAMRELGTQEVKESLIKLYGEDPVYSLTDEEKAEAWRKGKQGFDDLAKGYEEAQLFVMGKTPVFADFLLAGIFWEQMMALGKDSASWNSMALWMEGRVGRLLDEVEK